MKKQLYKTKTAWLAALAFIAAVTVIAYYYFVYDSTKEIDIKANYITYHSVAELEKAADLILTGTPADDFENRLHKAEADPDGTITDCYTITNIKIESIIKKPDELKIESGQSIQIIEPVGLIQRFFGKEKWKIDGYDEMKKDNEYIIFLKANSDGIYSVINMNSGRYSLIDDHTKQLIDRDSVLKRYEDYLDKSNP